MDTGTTPTSGCERQDPPTVSVMVVDDQSVFRHIARAVVDATAGFEPVGDAACGAEALASADQLHPDLVLMDVHMPDMNGFEAARRLTECHPDSVVVLFSLDDIEGLESVVTSCGASAFLRKQDLLPRTLHTIWATHGRSARQVRSAGADQIVGQPTLEPGSRPVGLREGARHHGV